MKAIEFCYWLQGYFELSAVNDTRTINQRGVECIRAHIELVKKVEPKHDSVFIEWLDMFLRTTVMDDEATSKVRRMLGAQFKHVIDPSYGGDQKELQEVHDRPKIGGVGPDGVLYRC